LDEELMELKDFVTTDYYKKKVASEALKRYIMIKVHLTRGLHELKPRLTFDGDRIRWLDFREQFKRLVHEVTDIITIKKMHYLRSCLKGEAAQVIAGIPMIPDDIPQHGKLY